MPKLCKIDTIAFGGSGITRSENKVIFAPFTVPGDVADIEIMEEKKQFAKGKLLNLVTSSPDRIEPVCPHFGTCGGCQLQHIRYEKQLEIKKQFVLDALSRIGKITHIPSFTITKARSPYHYRNHITLQIKQGKFGYSDHWENSFLPIHNCPIFDAKVTFFENDLPRFLQAINPPDTHLKIIKAKENSYVFSFYAPLPPIDPKLLEEFPFCQGIQAKGKTILGNTLIQKTILGLNVHYTTDFFMQNYLEQAENLYAYTLSLAQGSGNALDLYCGIGITTLLLAKKGFETTGIELNPSAIKHAKHLSTLNPTSLPPQFLEGDASLLTKKYGNNLSLLLVNPPKTGLSPNLIATILMKSPKTILYISCMPSTLARDLSLLQSHYTIANIQAFDMFPQTTHLETVVKLTLRD